MVPSGEERIDAKLEELERLIGDLQKRRQELLEAKEDMRAAMAYPENKPLHSRELVRPEKAVLKSPRPSGPDKSAAALEETLNALQWKSFKKKEGEWTFLTDREGRLIDELSYVRDFVEAIRKKNEVIVGRHKYRISEDKFLNRYLV